MDALYALAAKHKLRVIEDAALAIGSSWKGKTIGSFGDICVWSFHPNKNITSIEGGALVVNDEREAADVEMLRFHGIARLPDGTRDVQMAGGKFNLPDVNAAVGLRQLARLPEFNAKRRALVARYFARFRTDPPCELPHPGYPGDEAGHSWNMFAPLLPLRGPRDIAPGVSRSAGGARHRHRRVLRGRASRDGVPPLRLSSRRPARTPSGLPTPP